MTPSEYLDFTRGPLAELLFEYVSRKFPEKKSEYNPDDLRQGLLKPLLDDLQERLGELKEKQKHEKTRKITEQISRDRGTISHQRRILAFIYDFLNTNAHEHKKYETRILALAVSSAVSAFARSADLCKIAPWERLANYEVNLHKEVFSEYAESTDPESDMLGQQIDAVHEMVGDIEKGLKALLQSHESPPAEQKRLEYIEEGIKALLQPHDSPPTEQKKLEYIEEGIKALLQSHESPPTAERTPHHSTGQKRKELERIRQEISDMAEQRSGRRMEGYQHLIQMWKLDDLIEKNPSTLEELEGWARTLPSYEQNKGWINRQIKRWGEQIIACLNA